MRILFLANPRSFHLKAWKKIYSCLELPKPFLISLPNIFLNNQPPRFFILRHLYLVSKNLFYIFLAFRAKYTNFKLVHAHGASGYGIAAYLSGIDYIITVYGSEVMTEHSRIYRHLVYKVINNAKLITVTAESLKEKLISDKNVTNTNIICFHTGIDTSYINSSINFQFQSKNKSRITKCKILSVRNSAPVYRTKEIVQACVALHNIGYKIELTVILGNGCKAYFNKLRKEYLFEWINYIDSRIENHRLLSLIAASDVCISYASSDQLSTTVLECLYLNQILVLSLLPSYAPLTSDPHISQNIYTCDGNHNLVTAVKKAVEAKPSDVKNFIRDIYDTNSVAKIYGKYLGAVK
jgi:hypothetical protein